jgi:two-component system chemotaxis sensor kinase CheA
MFYEEARELLIGLEEGLMDLERRQSDRAHLDRTFRAAHSLKGAAAMVGLGAIAEFTHGIEAVLDRVRGGALPVDSEMITALLEARDHLAAMVEAEAARSPIAPSGELSQRLSALLRAEPHPDPPREQAPPPAAVRPAAPPQPQSPQPQSTQPQSTQPPPPPPATRPPEAAAVADARGLDQPPDPPPALPKKPARSRPSRKKTRDVAPAPASEASSEPAPAADSGLALYRITLAPGPEVLRRGINPLGMLDELRDLGQATILADFEAVPTLDLIDPERCYVKWTVELTTQAEPERLDETFLFLAEDSQIAIECLTPGRKPAPSAPEAQASSARLAVEAEEPSAAANGEAAAAPVPTDGKITPSTLPLPPTQQPARPAAPLVQRPHARIRVDAGQLDDLVGLAGELVVVSDNLMGLRELPGVDIWIHALESLQRVSRQIRDTTLDLRMVPVDELFSRFPRVVRDLADRSGKEIELRIIGQETRLDRTIVERLSDPMIHLIRNAADHALEPPAERLEKGKPRHGRITLSAGHEGDRVAIRVEDDGRGLDREKIVRKGIKLGMVPSGTSADDPRVVSLIFEPGFSTRDSVSELSGRGVGLDVVRDAVRALRGSVAVESLPGRGTAFIFRLPLTLALIDGLLVETAGGRYVVPLAQVEECVALSGVRSALAEGRPCVSVRGELVPMVSLRKLFHASGPMPARQELLLTRHAGQRVGVAVDRLVGRVQAVIQSLGEGLHGVGRFSGATILGDGSVSLILDLSALVSESRFTEHSGHILPRPA